MIYPCAMNGQHFFEKSRAQALPVDTIVGNHLTHIISSLRVCDALVSAFPLRAREEGQAILDAMLKDSFSYTTFTFLKICEGILTDTLRKAEPSARFDKAAIAHSVNETVSHEYFGTVANEFYDALEHCNDAGVPVPENFAEYGERMYDWYSAHAHEMPCTDAEGEPSLFVPTPTKGSLSIKLCSEKAVRAALDNAMSVLSRILAYTIAEHVFDYFGSLLGKKVLEPEVIGGIKAAFRQACSMLRVDTERFGPIDTTRTAQVYGDVSALQLFSAFFCNESEATRCLTSLTAFLYTADLRMTTKGKLTPSSVPGDPHPLYTLICASCRNADFVDDIMVDKRMSPKQMLGLSETLLVKYFGIFFTQSQYDYIISRLEAEGTLDRAVVDCVPTYRDEDGAKGYRNFVESMNNKCRDRVKELACIDADCIIEKPQSKKGKKGN